MVDVAKVEAAIRFFAERCDWIDTSQPLDLGHVNTDRHCYLEKNVSFPGANVRSALPIATYIGRWTYWLGGGLMSSHALIGRFTSISLGVNVGSSNHRLDYLSTGRFPGMPPEAVEEDPLTAEAAGFTSIGCDVWIGVNATILRGRSIGHGACIGAGSVVTHDIPPYAIAAGNPARIIRMRFPETIAERLLKTRWWMLPDSRLETLPYQNIEACLDSLEADASALL